MCVFVFKFEFDSEYQQNIQKKESWKPHIF